MKDLRNVPEILKNDVTWEKRRRELLHIFEDKMYGRMPEDGYQLHASEETVIKERVDGIKLFYHKIRITVTGAYGRHSFPLRVWLPDNGKEKHPVILYLGLKSLGKETDYQLGRKGMPPVSLPENGIGVAVCIADEIEKDDPEKFPEGLALAVSGTRTPISAGCLGIWAFGMMRAVDVLSERKYIYPEHIGVAGCSRCGKAALWCGANDKRLELTASFDSGCGGAAINRGKKDERITDMLRNFPHWLCLNANQYAGQEEKMPFDQHMLLGLISPGRLFVTSSTRDIYSDPYAEFLGLVYAQDAYRQDGFAGIGTAIWPPAGKLLKGERVAYYLREGDHGVEEEDWNALIAFWKEEVLQNE